MGTRTDPASDLEYVRTLAEEGARAPLLGGRYFLIWGVLVTAALLAHWTAITGVINLPIGDAIFGVIWTSMGVVGVVACAAVGPGVRAKPGATSAANRASASAWIAQAIGVLAFVLGAVIHSSVTGGAAGSTLFDAITAVAFCGYGVAFSVTAAMARSGWMRLLGMASFGAAFVVVVLNGRPELYLFAAAFVVVVVIVPGVILVRGEPSSVV